MRALIFIALTLGTLFLTGCKKNDPSPPAAAVLTEPDNNTECTPIQSSSDDTNLVRFSWLESSHTDIYGLTVENLNTGDIVETDLADITVTIPLEKGTPYSWSVTSENNQTSDIATSATWLFYSPGAQTDHVPFPAAIVTPKSGATVFKDINNEITLQWSGVDIDGDIESYTVYFSNENPPNELIASLSSNETAQKVGVISERVYYWRVVTTDALGNTSDTGIIDFKVY